MCTFVWNALPTLTWSGAWVFVEETKVDRTSQNRVKGDERAENPWMWPEMST